MRILLFILLSLPVFAQNKDWVELQGLIDSAKTSPTGIVIVSRSYIIDKPLEISNWNGTDYKQVSLSIIGYATMWDKGTRSVITATFNDKPVISIQQGKGVIIRGLNIQGGGSNGLDTRLAVHAGIAIDPYYKGGTRAGSTGIRIEDCTFNKLVAGVTTSINGMTQNAELITLQNIRTYDVKYCVIGCQAQEKLNRIINIGIWGPTHTAFMFSQYGSGTPGQWTIDGVNIAGGVDNLIYRNSGGYFPINMNNVYAETLGSIGRWTSGIGDVLSNSSINFRYREEKNYPPGNGNCEGLTIKNTTLRYYGRINEPILFIGRAILENSSVLTPAVMGRSMFDKYPGYEIKKIYPGTVSIKGNAGAGTVNELDARTYIPKVGDIAIIMKGGGWEYAGVAMVDTVTPGAYTIKYAGLPDGEYLIGIYKKL